VPCRLRPLIGRTSIIFQRCCCRRCPVSCTSPTRPRCGNSTCNSSNLPGHPPLRRPELGGGKENVHGDPASRASASRPAAGEAAAAAEIEQADKDCRGLHIAQCVIDQAKIGAERRPNDHTESYRRLEAATSRHFSGRSDGKDDDDGHQKRTKGRAHDFSQVSNDEDAQYETLFVGWGARSQPGGFESKFEIHACCEGQLCAMNLVF